MFACFGLVLAALIFDGLPVIGALPMALAALGAGSGIMAIVVWNRDRSVEP